ncbi:hypothetical protein KPL70_025791 [Citrus sinensis]|nr:hypothetical protein KPL70_025791 [Citrus sinensis]
MANPPSTTQEGVVGVELLEQVHGREEGRTQAKSRGKSKATSIDALEPRMATIETLMSALRAKQATSNRAEVDKVCLDWALHKPTLTPSPASTSTSDVHWIDVPKPDTYDGIRNATVVKNFLFGLEQYLDAMGVRDEASKVVSVTTSMTFTTLMLEISDMFDKDSLFYFQDGLKDWAKAKLDRRGVQTLNDAIVIAESLADYFAQPKDKRTSHGKKQPANTYKERVTYVSASINGQAVCALLDTGATHNFISEDEAKRLGLKVTKERGTMKAVNSPTKPIAGTAHGMRVTLGSWRGKLNFFIVSMDDFKMVLAMEFFDQVHAFPLTPTNSLSILDGSIARMVPTERLRTADKKLSAMQFKKAYQKNPSILVSIRELSDREDYGGSPSEVHPLIQGFLDEFKDVMPSELLKKLPSRREVDYEIELEQGAKQLALVPYHMAPLKLEELLR